MENKNVFKTQFIEQIKKEGFPVIAIFDYMDSGATIYAKSETEVYLLNEYGFEFAEENIEQGNVGENLPLKDITGEKISLNDVTEDGLYQLYQVGARPSDKYWMECFESAEEELKKLKDENGEE